MKMIEEASPRPDDVCEIDGDDINEVSDKTQFKDKERKNLSFYAEAKPLP